MINGYPKTVLLVHQCKITNASQNEDIRFRSNSKAGGGGGDLLFLLLLECPIYKYIDNHFHI